MKQNFKSYIYTFLLTSFIGFSVSAQSPFNGLVLEQLNNEGAFAGTTYRLYAELSSSEDTLYAIFGDENNPSLIETDGSFFNDESWGGNFQSEINEAAFSSFPTAEWDTWVTIGDSYDDAVNTIGDLNIDDFSDSSWSFHPWSQGCAIL